VHARDVRSLEPIVRIAWRVIRRSVIATLCDVVAEVRKVESGGMREEARCKCTSLFGRLPLDRAGPIPSWF
jgi:hypothetical protein